MSRRDAVDALVIDGPILHFIGGRTSSWAVEVRSGCWEWQGTLCPTRGYGVWGNSMAYRRVFLMLSGPIPTGWHIDHLCRNKPCVNPDHLEAVPARVNTVERGMNALYVAYRAGTCVAGHPVSERGVVEGKGPASSRRKQCLACRRERHAAQAADPEFRARRAAYEAARAHAQRLRLAGGAA